MSATATAASYSLLDRVLHRLAFSNIEIQKSLADIEDRIHATRVGSIAIDRPVFITGLPRAGTTLLLDVLVRTSGFATHTYRCMPFVLCPILWDSVSRGFRRPGESKERAHGDGMSVSYDSPEAFEEVLWTAFWPENYRAGRIELWRGSDRRDEFEQFFRNHIRKLIALSSTPDVSAPRYVSKNNANIARIPLLEKICPGAIFITPFRDPANQATSLLRQHTRFVEMQAQDPFTRRYMDHIGHFEFGSGMRLIDFPPLGEAVKQADPTRADFWLAYWIRAYGFLANSAGAIHFLDFDRLCADPRQALSALADRVHADRGLEQAAQEFHPAVTYDRAKIGFDNTLLAKADALHAELSARSLC